MVTPSWVQVTTVARACAPTARAAHASLRTAVTFRNTLTSWCVCAAPGTKVQSSAHFTNILHVSCNYPSDVKCPPPLPTQTQVPGAMSALRDTSGTRWYPVGAADPVSATATSTCMTLGHVTPGQEPVSNVCTTPRATRASTANWVTTATLLHRAAGVSTQPN